MKTAHNLRCDPVAPESDGVEHAIILIVESLQGAVGIAVNQNFRMPPLHLLQQVQMKTHECEAPRHIAAQQFLCDRLGKRKRINFQFNKMKQMGIFRIRQFQNFFECGNRSPRELFRLPAPKVIFLQFFECHGGNFPLSVRSLVNRRIMTYDNAVVCRPMQIILNTVAAKLDSRFKRRQGVLRIFFRESAMPANLNFFHFFSFLKNDFSRILYL